MYFFVSMKKRPLNPVAIVVVVWSFLNYAKQRVEALDLKAQGIRVSHSGCLGRCRLGPSVVVYPDNVWYRLPTPQAVDTMIQQHLLQGVVVTALLMSED